MGEFMACLTCPHKAQLGFALLSAQTESARLSGDPRPAGGPPGMPKKAIESCLPFGFERSPPFRDAGCCHTCLGEPDQPERASERRVSEWCPAAAPSPLHRRCARPPSDCSAIFPWPLPLQLTSTARTRVMLLGASWRAQALPACGFSPGRFTAPRQHPTLPGNPARRRSCQHAGVSPNGAGAGEVRRLLLLTGGWCAGWCVQRICQCKHMQKGLSSPVASQRPRVLALSQACHASAAMER